jgi:hypothetical protein
VKQLVAGTADDVFFRKGEELREGPVPPDDPLAGVENHDHVLDGVQDLYPVTGPEAIFHPILRRGRYGFPIGNFPEYLDRLV